MDFLERLNRRFGSWYEGLFGAGSERELRPRDILRHILAAMEDNRREGLDGAVYVPNDYTLVIASDSEDERDYLRAFLGADDLAAAVRRAQEQHGYRVRGGLRFTIEEADGVAGDVPRVQVRCRFDAAIPDDRKSAPVTAPPAAAAAPSRPPASAPTPAPARPAPVAPAPRAAPEDSEPGTVISFAGAVLATLVVRSADGRVLEAFPLTAAGVRIGRSRQSGNDIVLADDAMVSKRHARIDAAAGGFRLTDLGSTNGTFINSEPVSGASGVPLSFGDEVRLGETTIILKPVSDAARAASLPARSHAPAAARPVGGQDLAGGGDGVAYRLVSQDGASFALASRMTLGRLPTSDIVLDGEGVANSHARITREDGVVYVEDLDADGGTFVNGERIPARFAVALYDGDEVAFGRERSFRVRKSAGRR